MTTTEYPTQEPQNGAASASQTTPQEITWVEWHTSIRYCKAKKTNQLILRTMADYSDPDGSSVFPSIETLMADTGLSNWAVINAKKSLLASGHLIETRRESHRVIYRINIHLIMTEAKAEKQRRMQESADRVIESNEYNSLDECDPLTSRMSITHLSNEDSSLDECDPLTQPVHIPEQQPDQVSIQSSSSEGSRTPEQIDDDFDNDNLSDESVSETEAVQEPRMARKAESWLDAEIQDAEEPRAASDREPNDTTSLPSTNTVAEPVAEARAQELIQQYPAILDGTAVDEMIPYTRNGTYPILQAALNRATKPVSSFTPWIECVIQRELKRNPAADKPANKQFKAGEWSDWIES